MNKDQLIKICLKSDVIADYLPDNDNLETIDREFLLMLIFNFAKEEWQRLLEIQKKARGF